MKIRSTTRNRILAAIALLAAPTFALASISATTLPAGSTVTAGQASISTSGNTETINENGNAVITWKGGFDVGSQATVNFSNAGSGVATVLNVDNSGNLSEIAGTINGTNSNIIIANTNGVLVDNGANISNPGNTVALIGGNASENATTGDIGFGVDPYQVTNAPVTISNGATIGAGDLIVAGEGAVNMGDATYNVTGQTDILGSQNSLDPATIGFSAGKFAGIAAPVGGLNALAIPTTITIASGANIPMVNDIITAGYAAGQSNVTLDGNISSQNNGQGITFRGDSFQGSGMITTNNLHLSELYGNVNNPNNGGTAAEHWVLNHLDLEPQSNPQPSNPAPGFTNVYFGTLQNNGPQYFNLWVKGNAGYFFSEPTLNSPQAGSQLRLQASGEVAIGPNAWAYNQTTGQGPALYGNLTNTTQNPMASWPGLIAAVSNINANGTLESAAYDNPNLPNETQYQDITSLAPIDNAMAPGVEPGGNGIFMEAPTVGFAGGVTITGHPDGYNTGFNAFSNWYVVTGHYYTDQWTNLSNSIPGKFTYVEYSPLSSAIMIQPHFTTNPFVVN